MRCKACNTMLDTYDLKRKDKRTGEFMDLCGICTNIHVQAVWELTEFSEPVEIPEESS